MHRVLTGLGVGSRFWRLCAFGGVVAALVVLLAASDAFARKPRKREHSNSRAQKEKLIEHIRQQVAVAKRVLQQAESQASMSQVQLNAALQQVATAGQAIKDADAEEHSAASALESLEEELVDAAGADSAVGKAGAKLDEAEEAVDGERRRVLDLPAPADDGSEEQMPDRPLTAAEREALAQDAGYQRALAACAQARQEFARERTALFTSNPKWAAASQAVREAQRKDSEAKRRAAGSGGPGIAAGRQIRNAQALAAEARAIIANGEAKLRQLGVKANAPAAKKPKRK